MKKINDCYSMMQKIKKNNLKITKSNNNNVNSKLSKSNKYYIRKQNISNPYSDIKNSITYNHNKSKQKKSRCNTEYSKSTSKVKYNKNQILINSYEKSVISLFGTLKNIVEKSQYETLKFNFEHNFQSNLSQTNKEEKKSSSFINNSNSIKKIIDESIKKCNNNSTSNNNTKNSNVVLNITPSLNINKTHKSLYSLSRCGRRIITQSPNKSNQNSNSIIKKYYTVAITNKNSKSTQNGSSYLSGNKNSNSRQNISKELSFPKCNNNTNYNCINNNIIPNNKNYMNNNYTIQNNINNNSLPNKINEDNSIFTENLNNINKTVDDSHANNELLNKIKNSLDDSLKGIFAFSYEDFLNKSSDRMEIINK
jgi:hypothetical protein